MVNLYPQPHLEPEEPNTQYCLCINPSCSDTKRPISEANCGNCRSNLILNDRYRVIDILIPREKNQIDKCTLYDAIDITDNKKSKVIKFLHTDDQEAIIRFDRSADVLINNWFEGIPKIDKGGYFHIKFPDDPIPAYCLVMEKIEGVNLQQWLKNPKNKLLSEKHAINWLKQLAKILGKLHDKDFIHRDIKPSNIMLKNNGTEEEIILIDFDAVRPITQAVWDGKLLTLIGTDGYIPPEQRKGRAVPQSDFYALGITFVHLLTGKHPHELEDDRDKTLRWRSSAPQVSRSFADFIDNLMAWSSENRPKNTGEILEKLQEIERSLEHKKIVQTWLTFDFRKISGLIVFVLLGIVFYRSTIIPPPPLPPTIATPNSKPTFEITSTNDTSCRTTKDGEINVNALSDAANKAIAFVTDKNNPNRINLPRNRFAVRGQNSCKVIIKVYLGKDEQFTPEQKELITNQIKENIHPDAVELLNIDFQPQPSN